MSVAIGNRMHAMYRAALGFVLAGFTACAAASPTVTAVPGQASLMLATTDLPALGYQEDEFFISGSASSYRLHGEAQPDGRWAAVRAQTAPYKTRIVVVRPMDPAKFNGTVVVEWLNVTGGFDFPADWIMLHREIVRDGFAYVAVSAQKVGIEGGAAGPMAGPSMSLKKVNPARYGSLNHPGDAYSFDIFSQAGGILKGARTVLGPLKVRHVVAMGASQSALYLSTYVNAVDPVAKTYDGYLIHSRFGIVAPLGGGSLAQAAHFPLARLRDDLRVPVLTFITETDLVDQLAPGFHLVRQPDGKRLRIWEVAGTAHADNYPFAVSAIDTGSATPAQLAAAYGPVSSAMGGKFDKPMNFAPQHHYILEAALWHLCRWVATGKTPPEGVPIELTSGDKPEIVRDANGLAKGGIRSPWVDVPTAVLAGVGNSGSPLAPMVGVGQPFDAAMRDRLYPGGKAEYVGKFESSLDAAIKAGFILPADRQEILDIAPLLYEGTQ
jgi:hypothetical protein